MKYIDGGVCAAKGFRAGGISAGLKNSGAFDLALIVSETQAVSAAVFTKNVVRAAPLEVTKEHLSDGSLRAVITNSGNANACAPNEIENAEKMCQMTAKALNIDAENVAVASTGVIGQSLTAKMPLIEAGIKKLATDISPTGSFDAAKAIMTTDTFEKECAVEFLVGEHVVHIGAIAKGSGMIHPNMGTLLSFITTDICISPQLLRDALKYAVSKSFNRVSVDGDTSTNDTCLIMAGGMAGNAEITEKGADYDTFLNALVHVCVYLARLIAADGEGAGRLITCVVKNTASEAIGETLAKSVISSSLFKAAIFGSDANWGRVLCAMGYSGADFLPDRVSVSFESEFGSIQVCEDGIGLEFDEKLAKEILGAKEIIVIVDLHSGDASCTCWGCDLTYDYVRINGDYRS